MPLKKTRLTRKSPLKSSGSLKPGKPLRRSRPLRATARPVGALDSDGVPQIRTPIRKPRKRAIKAKKPRQPSIRTLDTLFSEYIRKKAGWKCEVCLAKDCSQQLQCSHIKSRRFHCTRWEPLNAVAQSAACHRAAHNEPDRFIRAIDEKWPDRIEKIQEIWLAGAKPDRQAIAEWLRSEIKKLDS